MLYLFIFGPLILLALIIVAWPSIKFQLATTSKKEYFVIVKKALAVAYLTIGFYQIYLSFNTQVNAGINAGTETEIKNLSTLGQILELISIPFIQIIFCLIVVLLGGVLLLYLFRIILNYDIINIPWITMDKKIEAIKRHSDLLGDLEATKLATLRVLDNEEKIQAYIEDNFYGDTYLLEDLFVSLVKEIYISNSIKVEYGLIPITKVTIKRQELTFLPFNVQELVKQAHEKQGGVIEPKALAFPLKESEDDQKYPIFYLFIVDDIPCEFEKYDLLYMTMYWERILGNWKKNQKGVVFLDEN